LCRLLQERLDDTLKGTDDVERLFGLSAVGLIPAVSQPNGNHSGVSRLLEHTKARSVKENGNGRKPNAAWYRIDEEGKQNATAGRSVSKFAHVDPAFHRRSPAQLFAGHQHATRGGQDQPSPRTWPLLLHQVGQRVLLVDADLRSPSLHRLFGVRENFGLVNYLNRSSGLAQRGAALGIPWPRPAVLRAHTAQSIGTSFFPKHGEN